MDDYNDPHDIVVEEAAEECEVTQTNNNTYSQHKQQQSVIDDSFSNANQYEDPVSSNKKQFAIVSSAQETIQH